MTTKLLHKWFSFFWCCNFQYIRLTFYFSLQTLKKKKTEVFSMPNVGVELMIRRSRVVIYQLSQSGAPLLYLIHEPFLYSLFWKYNLDNTSCPIFYIWLVEVNPQSRIGKNSYNTCQYLLDLADGICNEPLLTLLMIQKSGILGFADYYAKTQCEMMWMMVAIS